MKEQKIELAGLRFSTNRNYGGEGDIKILAEDIKRNGLINPITVKETSEEVDAGETMTVYEVVAGRRRVLAVTKLGWKDIPCHILEGDEAERADEIAGSENINRMAMHPLDEAGLFSTYLENGRTIEDLAKQYDRKPSEIWQRVQLLGLNDGIKELFRGGKIDLHEAAMLKSLDEEQQQVFYEKYRESRDISIGDIKKFISAVRHDKLYKCISGKKCAKCEKRTFYTDKTLFPQLEEDEDLCLDHECYMENWNKLLANAFKTVKQDHKGHSEANIVIFDGDELRKVFGKSLTLDGIEYEIKKSAWDNRPADKPKKDSLPCFMVGLDDEYISNGNDDDEETIENARLTVRPMYWKEPVKGKAQASGQKEKDPFEPIVKLLAIPEEEAKQTVAVLTEKCNTKDSWEVRNKASDLTQKAKHKVFQRIFEIIVKRPENANDIDLFLNHFVANCRGEGKNIVKMYTGSADVKSLKKLTYPKLFAALYAMTLNYWELPDVEDLDKGGGKKRITDFAGISLAKLKEMYQEELRPLMPKPKATADNKPTDKKPETKRKPLPKAEAIKKVQAKKAPAKKAPAKKTAKAKAKGKK